MKVDTGAPAQVRSNWVVVGEKRLRDRVWRLRLDKPSPAPTVIAKCVSQEVAARVESLTSRWLPAVDMADAPPALLRVFSAPSAGVVWLIYEDLGDWALAPTEVEEDRLRAVVRLMVRLHIRSASHPMLEEIRRQTRDLGAPAHVSTLRAAERALGAARARTADEAALLGRLCTRLAVFLDEAPTRAAVLQRLGGADTFLHGDLWPQNCIVVPEPSGLRARLVDWDRMGVGNAVYDLSTLLLRLPVQVRGRILRWYREEAGLGEGFSLEDMNVMGETCERTRLAEWTLWRAVATDTPDADWAWEELARVEPWLDVPALFPAGLETT